MSPTPPLSTEDQARLNQLLDIAPDAIIVLDEDQRILTFNRGAQQIFGYRAEEVLGRPLDLLLPPRFVEAHRRHIHDFAAAPDAARYMNLRPEVSGRRKDGTEFPAQVSLSKFTEQGQTLFLAILQDITERVQRESALMAIAEIGRLVTAGGDLQTTLDVLARKVAEATGFEGVHIALYDAEKQEMITRTIFTTRPMKLFEQLRSVTTPLAEAPVLQQLLRTQRHVIFENVQNDPRVLESDQALAREDGVQTVLALPLLYGGKLIGRLDLANTQQRALSPEDLRLLSTLADQVAVAVRNAHLFDEAQRRLREVSLLLDVSAAGRASLRVDEMLPIILDHLLTGLGAVGATALTADSSAGLVRVQAARGEYETIAGLTHRLEAMPAACALRSSRGVCFGQNDCPFLPDAGRPLKVACASFKIGEQTRGGLGIGARRSEAFGEDQIRLLRGTADIAANALRRAALFDEIRLYKDAFGSTAEGVAITDLQGHILDVNPAFERITGYSRAEALGQKLSLVKSQHSTPEFYRAMWAQILSQGYWAGEIINRRKNGEEWDAFLTISTVKDERGQPVAYVGINRDITELKSLQRERETLLAATQRRLAEITALHAVATAGVEIADENALIERATQIIGEALYPDNFGVLLLDEAAGVLRVHPSYRHAGEGRRWEIPLGSGITGHAAATGQTLRVPDVTRDSRYLYDDPRQRSEMAVPLKVGERVLGVVNTESTRLDAFSDADEHMLTTIAGQLATAIERVRLLEETQRRAAQLSTLNEIGRAVSTLHDVQDVLEIIYQQVRGSLPLDAFYVALYEAETGQVSFPLVYDEGQRYSQSNTPLTEDSHFGRTILEGAPRMINLSAEEFAAIVNLPHLTVGNASKPSASLLLVPLRIGSRVIGVLSAQSYSLNAYNPEYLALLTGVAYQAAITIQNARLFEAEREQRQLAEALRDTAAALNSTLGIDETMDRILGNLGHVVLHDSANVMLLDAEAQTARIVRRRGYTEGSLDDAALTARLYSLAEMPALRRMAETRQPVALPDVRADPDWAVSPGAAWVRSYLGAPICLKDQVIGFVNLNSAMAGNFTPANAELLLAFADQAGVAIDRAQLFDDLQHSHLELAEAYDSTLDGWSRALDLRDKETEGHTRRVTEIAERLARAMGISEAELLHVRRGALLHDIGKMGVPDGILLKPGPLTNEEWTIMRQHPQYAYDMLLPIAYLAPALDIPYCHHEKWDGTGYPRGLKGEEIPLAARIFAVADVWDALRSDRPYREGWAEEKVREYIREQSGKHFDPRVTEAFLEMTQ